MNVFVIEDSRRLRESIGQALANSGYGVETEENGALALQRLGLRTFDAIILDIMLPGLDGLEILKRLREDGDTTPVLCLTARDTLDDRVKGLQVGADDYLVKPFELRELLARVYALCRRRYSQYNQELKVADLVLDREAKEVARGGQKISLQPREFTLLEYLMLRPNQVVSRVEIERQIYDDLDTPLSNAVDSAICALRRKLDKAPGVKPLIHTRRGQGYLIGDGPS